VKIPIKDNQKVTEEGIMDTSMEKNLKVVCFSCGQAGHFSSACNQPRMCFICRSVAPVVDLYLEWLKAQAIAQYFGSANKGLGFYLVDVEDAKNRFKHWEGMDNFGVTTIEEGDIDEEGIVENLSELF